MPVCPDCQIRLRSFSASGDFDWTCPRCGGRAANLAILKKRTIETVVQNITHRLRVGGGEPGRTCPTCRKTMRIVAAYFRKGDDAVEVDVCASCQWIWFDADEFESLPGVHDPEKELTLEERQRIARAKVAFWSSARSIQEEGKISLESVVVEVGLPLEETNPPIYRWPYMTFSMVILTAFLSVLAWVNYPSLMTWFAFVPDQIERFGGLTLLTSFFFHADFWHLVGNLYFLFVFGDNVEEYLGPKRFLFLLALATLAGNVTHFLFDPHPELAALGASGGISGIIAFYGLAFPKSWIQVLVFKIALRAPAWLLLILWVVYQLVLLRDEAAGLSSISAAAHLGGAAVGIAFWLWLRARRAAAESLLLKTMN